MNILREGDKNAEKIIRQKSPRLDAEYRLSLYAWPFLEDGRHALMHTMTGEALELTASEWADVLSFQAASQSYETIERKGLTELAGKRYLVETDYDEAHAYAQTLFLLKTARGRRKGLFLYTILPTTGCNARCVYCFEEGMPVQTMTEATADRLIDYICETKGEGPVRLRWFGGEPLVGVNIIRRISAGLEERGVVFTSGMTTNASLLTRELAHEAKERWHLKQVQVSLDGAREDYALRKRFVQPDKHNYDAVMRAIGYLADEDIRVRLRVNVNMENLPRIEGFLDEMGALFGERENVTLYLCALYQELGTANYVPLQEAISSLNNKIRALGLGKAGTGKKARMRLNCCMADIMDGSVVITPDGRLYRCEHLQEGESWGDIFNGVTDPALYEALRKPPAIDPDCAKCPFLPRCTPFKRRGCPVWFEQCSVGMRLEEEDYLRELLRGAVTEGEADDEDDDDIPL